MAIFYRYPAPPPTMVFSLSDVTARDLGEHRLVVDVAGLSAAMPGADRPTPTTGAVSQLSVAASSEDTKPGVTAGVGTWASTVLILAVGLVIGSLTLGRPGAPAFAPPEGIGAFALFYVLAQSIERLIEFLTPVVEAAISNDKAQLNKAQLVKKRDGAVAAAFEAQASATDTAAANAQAELDQHRANRTLLLFGITAAIGMAATGFLNVSFLASVGLSEVSEWFAVSVTGLVIGGGSKQLHDLISNVQKAKENKEDPKATGGTAGS